ncbi:hypothetical protein [Gordonia soli]|uniref:Uncharacterized protein n=1 Tax=Gordonia soli NBRC 108243 TaxID=1223545 RepID=M0QEM0_9ACTN|nr:hypothetical protein [Gordonia soli]GAC67040.1 hypothetical protein GS4_05_02530 [Gordonia soli NBRC 108243]
MDGAGCWSTVVCTAQERAALGLTSDSEWLLTCRLGAGHRGNHATDASSRPRADRRLWLEWNDFDDHAQSLIERNPCSIRNPSGAACLYFEGHGGPHFYAPTNGHAPTAVRPPSQGTGPVPPQAGPPMPQHQNFTPPNHPPQNAPNPAGQPQYFQSAPGQPQPFGQPGSHQPYPQQQPGPQQPFQPHISQPHVAQPHISAPQPAAPMPSVRPAHSLPPEAAPPTPAPRPAELPQQATVGAGAGHHRHPGVTGPGIIAPGDTPGGGIPADSDTYRGGRRSTNVEPPSTTIPRSSRRHRLPESDSGAGSPPELPQPADRSATPSDSSAHQPTPSRDDARVAQALTELAAAVAKLAEALRPPR